MKFDEALEIVREIVVVTGGSNIEISDEMPLIGTSSQLDSMKLVELCLGLEEAAEEHGFEFDWTSDNAMSRSTSMFRDIKSLSEEFANQSEK